jgi:hypothetical protein
MPSNTVKSHFVKSSPDARAHDAVERGTRAWLRSRELRS